jgi:hypothetical protein
LLPSHVAASQFQVPCRISKCSALGAVEFFYFVDKVSNSFGYALSS